MIFIKNKLISITELTELLPNLLNQQCFHKYSEIRRLKDDSLNYVYESNLKINLFLKSF